MMNRNTKWMSLALSVTACVAVGMLSSGCTKEEEQAAYVPPPPPPPPPPEKPAVTPIADLMAELNIDSRIDLPEEAAPGNDQDRKAVLVFFDTIARANAASMKGMLALSDQLELDKLVDSGQWQQAASNIKKIQIQTGINSLSQNCALAVIEVGSGGNKTYQPQLWYYTHENDAPLFEAAPAPPDILDKLSGDWIAAWHQILADEMALADKPDEEYEIAQKDLDESDTGPSATPSRGGGGLRNPGGAPQPAPGAPGGPGSPGSPGGPAGP